jgi:peroxiredoxin
MSDYDDELDRIFEQAAGLDQPLQQRLDLFTALYRTLDPELDAAYQRLAARLAESGAGSGAPVAGDELPDFLLPDDQGRLVRLDELVAQGPVVMSLNRGHWCEYCMLELRNLAALAPRIERYGATIISITPERQRFARQLKAENGLPFRVLTDLDNAYSMALGLMVWVGKEVTSVFLKIGVDLREFQGNDGWFLPIPATFVVGPDRIIVSRFVDPDFRRRMTSEAVIEALERLADGG